MALPGPDENNPADVPTDIDKLRKQIDALAAIYGQGTTAARPAAGTAGRLYYSTDEHLLYWDDGSVWQSPYTPPGTLRLSAAAAVASGWLLCDGAAYPRAEYAALFSTIGTTWGAGDGSSTFNVPDLRGRAPVGQGTGTGLTARTVGAKGGEEAHTLATAELPAHSHPLTDPGHAHLIRGYAPEPPPPAGGVWASPNSTVGALRDVVSAYTEKAGITMGNTGSGTAHNVMQPFAVVAYLIKT
jgi:microcystin-dependent protein